MNSNDKSGKHVLIEGHAEIMETDPDKLNDIMSRTLAAFDYKALHRHSHKHDRPDGEVAGFTLWYLLESGHATLHTCHTSGRYFLDIFVSDGEVVPSGAAKSIAEDLGGMYLMKTLPREYLDVFRMED
jgi:S-adenosylmethionine/arginine decarboxylase-like enzyme